MFGKGKLDLTDPADSPATGDNALDASKDKKSTKGYGATDVTTPKAPTNRSSLWTIETPATSLQKEDSDDSDDPSSQNESSSWPGKADIKSDEEAATDDEIFHERTGRPNRPKRHCCVQMFFAIASYAIASNLALLVSQILPLFFVPIDSSDIGYVALKVYICIFSIIFIVVELDHPSIPFFRKASFLKTFVSRGFLYTFFGLVCFEEADSEKAYKALEAKNTEAVGVFEVAWFALFNQIAAFSLIALGILYFLMGIFCLQRVRNGYVYDDRKKWEAYREALKKWNDEA